jgi:hypothetical protein
MPAPPSPALVPPVLVLPAPPVIAPPAPPPPALVPPVVLVPAVLAPALPPPPPVKLEPALPPALLAGSSGSDVQERLKRARNGSSAIPNRRAPLIHEVMSMDSGVPPRIPSIFSAYLRPNRGSEPKLGFTPTSAEVSVSEDCQSVAFCLPVDDYLPEDDCDLSRARLHGSGRLREPARQ